MNLIIIKKDIVPTIFAFSIIYLVLSWIMFFVFGGKDIYYDIFWLFVFIMVILYLLIIAMFIKPIYPIFKRKKQVDKLLADNNKIIAKIERVEPAEVGILTKEYQKMNTNNGDQVICSWIDPNTKESIEFGSDGTEEEIDIKYIIEELDIKEITVYLDSNNKSNYYVDISEILNRCIFKA